MIEVVWHWVLLVAVLTLVLAYFVRTGRVGLERVGAVLIVWVVAGVLAGYVRGRGFTVVSLVYVVLSLMVGIALILYGRRRS